MEKDSPWTKCLDAAVVAPEPGPEAGEWLRAGRSAGRLVGLFSVKDLEGAVIRDGRLLIGGVFATSLVLSSPGTFSAGVLDTLLNFVLFGGRIAASGPRARVVREEGRSAASLEALSAMVERYTSRVEEGDVVDGRLFAAALPCDPHARPRLRGSFPIEEAASLGGGSWRVDIARSDEHWSGSLQLPWPVASMRVWDGKGRTADLGGAHGPEVAVEAGPGEPVSLTLEVAGSEETAMAVSESGWLISEEGGTRRADASSWPVPVDEKARRYVAFFKRGEVPCPPAGGTLFLQLDAGGAARVFVDGSPLPPMPGNASRFPVPRVLSERSAGMGILVSGESGAEDPVGLFSPPEWVLSTVALADGAPLVLR